MIKRVLSLFYRPFVCLFVCGPLGSLFNYSDDDDDDYCLFFAMRRSEVLAARRAQWNADRRPSVTHTVFCVVCVKEGVCSR